MVRQNLAQNPALKTSAATWFGPSGWARITGAHASLPRSTAYAGTVAGDTADSRFACVAGRYYVGSISIRFVAASVGQVNIDWYNSGDVYLSTSNGPTFNQTGGTTLRLVTGVGQAPTDATRGVVTTNSLDGETQQTALLVEEFLLEADATAVLDDHALASYYFDGDTAGAVWDGTDGESTSTLAAAPSLTAELASPVAVLTPTLTITAPVLTAALASPQASIGLLVSVLYDDLRGRIRVSAQGMPPEVVRAVVSSRPAGGTRWTQVRGGRVAIQAAAFLRTVDDYEFVAGVGMEYRIQALSSQEGAPDVVVQTRVVSVAPVLDRSWVKFISAPHLNTRVEVVKPFGGAQREARVALYAVAGRKHQVAVTDVHTGRAMTVQVVTRSLAARDALDNALGDGRLIFLHTPATVQVPSMYAAVGNFSWEPAGPRSVRSIFTIALTEVAPPPPSVVGVGLTYGVLASQFTSYADVSDAFTSYGEMG